MRRLAVLTAVEAMREAHEQLDEELRDRVAKAEATAGARSPCRKGCAHCCYQPVEALSWEMPLLLAAIRDLPERKREQIRRALRRAVDRLDVLNTDLGAIPGPPLPDVPTIEEAQLHSNSAAYMRRRIACPLLDRDGTCLVYAARPMACRTHAVVGGDPAACADPASHLAFVAAKDLARRARFRFSQLRGTEEGLAGLLVRWLSALWPLTACSEEVFVHRGEALARGGKSH